MTYSDYIDKDVSIYPPISMHATLQDTPTDIGKASPSRLTPAAPLPPAKPAAAEGSESEHFSMTGFTFSSLSKKIAQAQQFHAQFLLAANGDPSRRYGREIVQQAAKSIRRSGGVPQAVLSKLGSNSFSKRQPEDTAPYLAYVQGQCDSGAPLLLRVVVGPIKNVKRFGAYQEADLAEYLMFIQLARLVDAIAPLYPYGVRVQMIPDDRRGQFANCWPEAYSRRYISSLRAMAKTLNLDPWLDVEDGQSRLYDLYNVKKYLPIAREEVMGDPQFSSNFARACLKARENFISGDDTPPEPSAIRDSAMRYLISHKAEILSGMWSIRESMPLIYANHPGNYQLYTMGPGQTKLPWQIMLPADYSI